MSKVIDFLWHDGKDTEGRTLEEILTKSFDWMEVSHDYIQWLFPLNEPSNYNPDAPVLTEEDILIIRENIKAPKGPRPQNLFFNIFDAVAKYLFFMGIQDIWYFDSFDGFKLAENFAERKHVWLGQFNHNHLRITRMLTFLNLIGWNHYGKALLEFMKQVSAEQEIPLNPNSVAYWEVAVENEA